MGSNITQDGKVVHAAKPDIWRTTICPSTRNGDARVPEGGCIRAEKMACVETKR